MTPPPDVGDGEKKPDDDPLGGMDPMAWLESLARRQGANPDELITSANLEIPLPSSDAAPVQPDSGPAPVEPPTPEPAAAAVDDPLGGMDPMAWLESLARRQGANPDELMTAADLNIPTPSEPAPEPVTADDLLGGADTMAWLEGLAQPEELPTASSEFTPPPLEPVQPPEPAAVTSETVDDLLGGMDPMAWLESLARRQGANADEFTTAADLEIPLPPVEPVEESQPLAMEPPEPAALTGESAGDLLGGADPMAWLESLARRQGANPDELTTAADLEIPLPPTPEPAGAVEAAPQGEMVDGNDPMAWLQGLTDVQFDEPEAPSPAAPEPVPATADDLLGGADPMAWLESLARRQGANPDELTTAADLEIPMPSADAVPDEPGYADFDPFSARGVSSTTPVLETPEPMAPPPQPEPVASDAFLGGMDPLEWLESLAARQGANPDELVTGGKLQLPETPALRPAEEQPEAAATPMSDAEAAKLLGMLPAPESVPETSSEADTMAWLESLANAGGAETFATDKLSEAVADQEVDIDAIFAAPSEAAEQTMAPESALSWLESLTAQQTTPAAEAPEMPAVSMEGGMSKDINEVQAWLEAQARNLETTREILEFQDQQPKEVPPAEVGQIPDWLLESMPQDSGAAPTPSPLSAEIALPVAPGDLPPWLADAGAGSGVESVLDFESALAETEAAAEQGAPQSTMTSEELEALTRPTSPEEVDSWAEALDEEYDRRRAGDESIPDWYLEAVNRIEEPIQASTIQEESPVIIPESEAEMPDWLRSMAPESGGVAATEALPGDIPGWLTDMSLEAESLPLPEPVKQAEPVVPPPFEQAPPPEPTPVVTAPEPVTPPAAKVVPPEPIKQAAPVMPPVAKPAPAALPEHAAVLTHARQLVEQNQLSQALEEYQALIDGSQLLEETRGDLRNLVARQPKEPKLYRLLGDTHMRLGDLQSALDTYLSALNQL